MGRITSFPTVFEDIKTISITELKKWGYINANKNQSGTLYWKVLENRVLEVKVFVFNMAPEPFIVLNYTVQGKNIIYKILLTFTQSNLGKGKICLFLCPKTGKKCRKLYFVNGLFLHRDAYNGIFYKKQLYSKEWRRGKKKIDKLVEAQKLTDELEKPYARKFYNGVPTKSFKKLLNIVKENKWY